MQNRNTLFSFFLKSFLILFEKQHRGLEKMAENLQTLEVDASIGQGLMEYGRDYALGDIVPLKLTRYGLRLSARISAVRTIYESTGKKVTAVLSDFNLTKEALSR